MDFEPTFFEWFKVIVALQIFQECFGFLGLHSLEQFKINGVLKVFKSTSIWKWSEFGDAENKVI